jgi:hypothetical protein
LALGAYEPGVNEERVLLSSSGLNLMRPDADIVVFATDLRDETPIWVGALLAARTERVLACQWEQDPWATAALVRSFYETWNRGDSPASAASALRQAQLAVASKGEYRHPYYWAGWQLWGLP